MSDGEAQTALRNGTGRFLPGDLIGGRYRVHRHAAGGVGEVYFCLDERSGTPVALKTLRARFLPPSERNERVRHRLEAEAAIWASLSRHPNVVRCFYLTIIDDAPFLCLEWVADPDRENVSLHALVAKHGPRELRQALEIAIDVCDGLAHVAETQPDFVHRDLKVENVLIGPSGVAKVTDFGFALVAGGVRLAGPESPGVDVPWPEHIVGTPTTMAPEQWVSGSVDARADVYAIGCILFRMLAGHGPFKAERRQGYRAAHCHAPVPTLGEALPTSVGAILDRCLAKAREDRFQTIAELRSALERVHAAQFAPRAPAPRPAGEMTVEERINRGTTYYHLGRPTDALRELDRAVAEGGGLAAVYGRALAWQALGMEAEAFAAYEAVLDEQPRHAGAYCNRGNLHRSLGACDLALADYTRAIEADPLLHEAWNNRGILQLEAGRREEALADFGHAAAAGSREGRRNRAAALIEEGHISEARDDLEWLGADPHASPADLVNRARLRVRIGELRGALDDYTTALAAGAPDVAALHCERAGVYRAMGRPRPAIEDLSVAIRLDSGLLAAYRARAQVWYELREPDAAVADYASILTRAPDDADAYYALGLVLGTSDRSTEAVACLSEAARLGQRQASDALASFKSRGWLAAPYTDEPQPRALVQGRPR